jgi:hypothetical protein
VAGVEQRKDKDCKRKPQSDAQKMQFHVTRQGKFANLSFSGSLIIGLPHLLANNSLSCIKPMHCNQGLGKASPSLLQGTIVDITPQRFYDAFVNAAR